MRYLILAIIFLIAVRYIATKSAKRNGPPPDQQALPANNPQTETSADITAIGHYKSKWLFSYNEKDAYRKLKDITDRHELFLFTKVRLLDLIEPINGIPHYKTYFYKIQAKHVDFVICDKKLVARCIIELDDTSHQAEDRQKQDHFVDDALQSAGYTVLHILAATDEMIENKILDSLQ